MLAPHAPLTLAVASVLAAFSLGGCQQIPRPKPNSPRLKLEVAVAMDDSFSARLASVDDKFQQGIAEQVKLNADVEDRFYATLSSEYSSRQTRPEYLMTVDLGSFDATLDKEVKEVKEEGNEAGDKAERDTEQADNKETSKKASEQEASAKKTGENETGRKETGEKKVGKQEAKAASAKKTTKITRWVSEVTCSATVTLQRRQENGPALLVDRSKATVRIRIPRLDPGSYGADSIAVNAEGEGGPVRLTREQLLKAVESAMRKSLRPMVATIDRELMLHSGQGTQPVPGK